jgi:F-type H+-transporting ATPase subunit b
MLTRFVCGCLFSLALAAGPALAAAGDAQPVSAQPDHPADAAANHDEGDLNPVPMSWQQVKGDLTIWTAAVFLLLLLILWKFAWGPLASGLDKREKHIADQIDQANEANQKATELLAGYEKKLADSQEEVRAILEKARRDAEQVGREMIDKAKADAKVEQQRMLKQIDAATAAAIKELADRSAALAVDLAGKIVRAKLSPQDHAQLIEQAVGAFAESKESVSRN